MTLRTAFKRWAPHLVATLVIVSLAAIHTWPLATSPGGLVLGHPDALLNAWIVCWVAHQAFADPAHLFDTNAFYPETNTLALGEPLLIPGLVAAPLRWAGATAVQTHNLVWLAGFALSALAMYALVFNATRDRLAGLLAGSVYAFNTHTLARMPHMAAVWVMFLPLALLAVNLLIERGRRRHGLGLGLAVAAAAMTSGHLGIFTLVAVAVVFTARVSERVRPLGGVLWRMALGAAVALLLVWPMLRAYGAGAPVRSLVDVAANAATPAAYVTTIGKLHYGLWSHRFYEGGGETLFPGVLAGLLAAVPFLLRDRGARSRRHLALAAVGAVGVLLSFGPAFPPYRWLNEIVPLLTAIRVPSRFGFLLIAAVAALAGHGLAMLRARHGSRLATVGALAAVAIVNVEAYEPGTLWVPYDEEPGVYERLRENPDDAVVVAEFPFHGPERFDLNGVYLLGSTYHWRPLVNGFNGGYPDSFVRIGRRLERFPEPPALRQLRDLGVNRVVVHTARYDPDQGVAVVTALEARPGVRLIASDREGRRLYRLRVRPQQRDVQAEPGS